MGDNYDNFAALAKEQIIDVDYSISITKRPFADFCIIAPHGGSIERRTSAIASAIAGDDYSLYLFEGLDPAGSFELLHITSHKFDEPRCLDLIRQAPRALTVHGCSGDKAQLFLGGRDFSLIAALYETLLAHGIDVHHENHRYLGRHRDNICNRGQLNRGVQLEFTDALRGSPDETIAINAIRTTLTVHRSPANNARKVLDR